MKKLLLLSLIMIGVCTVTFAQNETKKPEPPVTAKEAAKPDPLLLTDAEKEEVGRAVNFYNQSKQQFDQSLEEALGANLERLNALETLGRLQKANAVLQAAQQHLSDLREKHRATRPDCAKCDYAPDGSRLVRPPAK